MRDQKRIEFLDDPKIVRLLRDSRIAQIEGLLTGTRRTFSNRSVLKVVQIPLIQCYQQNSTIDIEFPEFKIFNNFL